MTRALSLAPELLLGLATLVAASAMYVGIGGAARVAQAAARWGAAVAAIAAMATVATDDAWFFEALRVTTGSQLVKFAIALGTFVSAGTVDLRVHQRSAQPTFRLVAALALCLAASAGDLVVLWIALDLAVVAIIVVTANGGSWQARGTAVRAMLESWLLTTLLLGLGIILLAAVAGSTRYGALELVLPGRRDEPVVIAGVLLVMGGILARALRIVRVLTRESLG